MYVVCVHRILTLPLHAPPWVHVCQASCCCQSSTKPGLMHPLLLCNHDILHDLQFFSLSLIFMLGFQPASKPPWLVSESDW
jgi:hypothetical protein